MTKQKILHLSFYILMAISALILGIHLSQIKGVLLSDSSLDVLTQNYNLLQKQIGVINIVVFMVLLVLALIKFYYTQSKNFIWLANIFFIAISLVLYVSINRNFYQAQQINYSEESNYWLTLFMGIFYMIGGILISAIGFITVRNNAKRKMNIDKQK